MTSADAPATVLADLVDGVSRVLPATVVASVLQVERARSLGDRLAGRPGTVTSVKLVDSGETLTLVLQDGKRLVGEEARVSGGVIISRRTLPVGEWLTEFAGRVAAMAADAAGDSGSATRALAALGVRPAGSEVVVEAGDIDGGLATLAARVRGRIGPDDEARVARIAALLRDTLPRVAGVAETEYLVERTATDYLPDTLRAFLALPPDWAATHVLADGSTPAQSFAAQLVDLEQAATRMRDAAVEQDASALLVNGRFLADRFPEAGSTSAGLDLH